MDMLIAFFLFSILAISIGALIAEAFERRQDVLYGPDIKHEERR